MPESGTLPLTGGCSCRAVRYRVTRPPLFVHCCHCSWCQRETGSAFVVNVLLEAEALEISGTPDPVPTPSESGIGQTVFRCPECRVALYSHYRRAGRAVAFLRGGTLDDPAAAPPDIHIFTSSKQDWVQIPAKARQVPEFYDYESTWPEEAFARRAAAIARIKSVEDAP